MVVYRYGKVTTAFVYKNLSFWFIYNEMSKWLPARGSRSGTGWENARLKYIFRVSPGTAQIYTISSCSTPGWDRYIQSLTSSGFFHGRLILGRFSTRESQGLLRAKRPYSVTWLFCWLPTDCDLWLTASFRSWKLPLLYIFWTHMHSSNEIHVAFPLTLVQLKTELHVLFWIHKLTGLSKVNM